MTGATFGTRMRYWDSKKYVSTLRSVAHGAVRRITRRRCGGYEVAEGYFAGRTGLEIGGPSTIFRKGGLVPVYDRCRRIDSCNFSVRTIWSNPGEKRGFGPRLGRQFVAEAGNLAGIADGEYEFVLASHVLEHVANPLRALEEWKRVVAPGGLLVVIVPDRRWTFDHRRPLTTFEHLEADYRSGVSEDDLTHLDEILALHDLELDPPAGSHEEFRKRCLSNASIRAMHHHVFNPETMVRIFSWCGMHVVSTSVEAPFHIVVMGERAAPSIQAS